MKIYKNDHGEYGVFVGHSTSDEWIARVILEKIEALGARCWLDKRDLSAGGVVVDGILEGIAKSHEVALLISPKSVKSQWIMFEIGAARIQGKRVTPILNDVKYDAIKPLRDVKAIELNEMDTYFSQIKQRIRKHRLMGGI